MCSKSHNTLDAILTLVLYKRFQRIKLFRLNVGANA